MRKKKEKEKKSHTAAVACSHNLLPEAFGFPHSFKPNVLIMLSNVLATA